MKTSQVGIDLIKVFEGCRLSAYLCPAKVPTIGYGHTAGVKLGQTITQAQAEAFLKEDLVKYEQKVLKYDSTYHWNQNEFDALVSFAYNIGNIDQLTANGTRDRNTIASKMLEYNKANKKVVDGLVKRRAAEQELFLTPVSCTGTTETAKTAKQCSNQNRFYVRIRKTYKKRANAKAMRKQLRAAGFDAIVVKEVIK